MIKLPLLVLQTVSNPGVKQRDSTTVPLNRISVRVIPVPATCTDEVPADAARGKVQARSPSQLLQPPLPVQMEAEPCRCRRCWETSRCPFLFIPEAAALRVPLSHYIFARDNYDRKGTCAVTTPQSAVRQEDDLFPRLPGPPEQVPGIGERWVATEGSPAADQRPDVLFC